MRIHFLTSAHKLSLQAAEQPDLPWDGLARKPPHPVCKHPGADSGAAEGTAVRADRRGDVADAHAQGQPALPLLCQPGRAAAWARGLPGRPGSGGRDRGGGDRPAARVSASRRSSSALGARRAKRRGGLRSRCSRGVAAARSALDRLFPAEQARIVQLLVERVLVGTDGVTIRLRTNGLPGPVRGAPETARRAA